MNLRNLQKYSITKNFFEEFRHSTFKLGESRVKTHISIQSSSQSSPQSSQSSQSFNTLFWSFYSLVNSDYTAEMKEQHGFKLKNDFGMTFIEKIKRSKSFLKEHKLRFHDIEASLLYDQDISLTTFKALVLFNKLNVVYIWNNKYYIFEGNDDNNKFDIIQRTRSKHNSYTIEHDLAKDYIHKNRLEGKLFMEDTRTQLKSVSSYKLSDLKTMAETLGIFLDKKKTKQVLYEEINSKID